MFQKLDKVKQAFDEAVRCLDASLSGSPSEKNPSVRWHQTIDSIFEEIKRRVPDIQVLLRIYHQNVAYEQKSSSDIMSDEVAEEYTRNSMIHEVILKLIKYYHKFLPEAVMESKFDIGKFIPSNLEEIRPTMQLHLLELLLISNFNLTNKPDLVLQLLEESISIFFKDPFPYIDELSQIINDVNSDVRQIDIMDVDELRIAKDISIDFAEKLCNIYYGSKDIPFSYPFSPLLAVVMKQYQNMKPITVEVTSFLHKLFKNLLNKQITTSYLDVYVKQLNKIIGSSLKNLDRKSDKNYIGDLETHFQQFNSCNIKWSNNKDESRKMIEDTVILQFIEAYMPPGLIDNENAKNFQFIGKPTHFLLVKIIDSSVVRFILDNMNTLKAKILSCLIICSPEIRLEFVNLILLSPRLLESVSLKGIIIIVSTFIDIVSSKTHLQIDWSPVVTESNKNAIKVISDKCALRFFRSITTSYTEKSPSIYASVVCVLMSLSPPMDLMKTLKLSIQKGSFDLFSLDYLSIIERHLANNINDYDEQDLKTFISSCLHQATLFMEKDIFKNCSNEALKAIFNKIDDLIKFVPKSTSLDANIIGEFIFVLLEKKIDEPTILRCITSLIVTAYNKETVFGPSLDKVVEAIINNPQFKALCGAPDAMMWGPGAVRQFDRRSLMGQRILVESLDLIDPIIMMQSYTHFPIDKELEVPLSLTETASCLKSGLIEDSVKWEKDLPVYDPSYFLPLFSNLLSYGNLLDVRRFIEINALGFIVVSLSSTVESLFDLMNMKYDLIFHHAERLNGLPISLQHATFREKSQILLLLNSLKNSIVDRDNENKPLQRIPTIISVFIAHALNVFTNPAHFMYPIINKFLLQRPILDLE
ncbi:7018_t:CDS:2, partial [Racocetra fulgida]